MRIVMIHGQSHKGTSYYTGRMLAENLVGKEHITEYFLPKDMSEFCCGCFYCILKGEEYCPHYSILQPITMSLEDADLLVFTTPVYCMRTTGSMKAFLDHYFSWWMNHRPNEKMFYKKAIVISVGAGGGMKKAANDIVTSLDNWGISNIRTYRKASMAMKWEEVKEKRKRKIELGIVKLAESIKKKDGIIKVRMGKKFHFTCMRMVHSKNWGISQDKEYWKAKGWLDKNRPWSDTK